MALLDDLATIPNILRHHCPECKEGYVESRRFEGMYEESDETFRNRLNQYYGKELITKSMITPFRFVSNECLFERHSTCPFPEPEICQCECHK